MTRPRAGRLFLGAAALLVLLTVAGALPVTHALVVRSAPPGEPSGDALLVLPLRPGEEFELRYVHSLNRFNVHEVLRYSRDGVLVVATQFVDGSGAGIGEVPGEAVFVDAGGGWERLDGLERPIDDPMILRVGGVADQRIVLRDREFTLLEVARERDRVSIGRERSSPFRALRAASILRDAPSAIERRTGESD